MKNQNTKPSDANNTSQYNYPHLFRTAYGPHLKETITFTGPGRTKQSFKAECDVNNIVARFLKTGVLDAVNKHAPKWGDCTGLEFQAGMETVIRAQNAFKSLPAELRNRFQNDPGAFLDFVHNDENREEARKLGLLKPEEPKATPLPTPPASDAPTPPLASRSDMRKAARAAGDAKADREQDY